MQPTTRVLAVLAALFLFATTSPAQTLTGAQAQASPQADSFLAYEAALIAGGLDAARPHMTGDKVADLESMIQAFGAEGFEQFLDRMRGGARGEARRAQILSVEISGEHAVLEARDDPNTVTVQHLAKTASGWTVDIKR